MAFENQDSPSPLAALKVIALSDGKTDMCSRLLADLGADVVLLERPEGDPSRRSLPVATGTSYYFRTHAANKRSVVIDWNTAAGQASFEQLVGAADMLIDASGPDTLAQRGYAPERLQAMNGQLVLLSISDFGLTGPYRDFVATNAVHLAMAGVLSRSGLPRHPPLLPPGNLACEVAAMQAAWAGLLGYWQRLKTGCGDLLDFSICEATAQVIDPAFGATGSAMAGRSLLDSAPGGRPPLNALYPIFKVQDGYVRVCILAPAQWRAMSEWLGSDHRFTDAVYARLGARSAVIDDINELIRQLFSIRKVGDIVQEARQRGVPVCGVATTGEVLHDPHFQAREAFVELDVGAARIGRVPAGYLQVNGQRAGIRTSAPSVGQHTRQVLSDPRWNAMPKPPCVRPSSYAAPFKGLRVLDFGIIVAGAEAGRALADQGAEVIKIESREHPDGSRQSLTNAPMTPSFAQGHRGKQSLGINLKSSEGRALFEQLVRSADVVLSNFRPGTLDAMGLSHAALKLLNPRIIVADSSAFGSSGPDARTLGYGPLVRARTGLTRLWSYPERPEGFSDGVTIFPDHFAARLISIGVLSLLIARENTGTGGTVSVSQAECILNVYSEFFLRESVEPDSFVPRGNAAEFACPSGVYPCAGDDEWCVIAVETDEAWKRFATAVGLSKFASDPDLELHSERVGCRREIDAAVAEWTRQHTPFEVMRILQKAGVPAGMMRRIQDYEFDPQFQARGFFRTLSQPGVNDALPTENTPVKARSLPEPDIRPAPLQGEHTRQIARELLGMDDARIDVLMAMGVLEE